MLTEGLSLPVLFWSQLLSCIVVIGASLAPSYAGFTACRTLQGFFNTDPQVIGLTIIHDMFFFHERARKINIWAFSFLVGPYAGPYAGPFVAGFLIQKINWRQDFGVLAAFYGFSTILVMLFGDETLYDRENPNNNTEAKGLFHRLQLLTGIAGFKAQGRPTLKTVFKDIFEIAPLPYLILPCKYFNRSSLLRNILTFCSCHISSGRLHVGNWYYHNNYAVCQTTTLPLQ